VKGRGAEGWRVEKAVGGRGNIKEIKRGIHA